jgi:hypothetical protein
MTPRATVVCAPLIDDSLPSSYREQRTPMTILAHLAHCYRQSTHGRKTSARDFIIDSEKFLRSCGMADGEEREMAERELKRAETASAGLLCIDRHRRTGQAEKIRLLREGGEAWLFAQINASAPADRRAVLERFFLSAADQEVPPKWQQAWTTWFLLLANLAHNGESVKPFRRDDPEGNDTLVKALSGILHWSAPALIRYASTAICGDSKQLQRLEPRLRQALQAITGSDSLENFGILRKPRFVTIHGPLILLQGEQQTDFGIFPAPVSLAETNFTSETIFTTHATICLTVENEDTFHELAATNPGVILILTSYAGSAVRHMIRMLPSDMTFLHYGDHDPAGADILRDLREKTQRDIHPLIVRELPNLSRRSANALERRTLLRLCEATLPEALRIQVESLLEHGIPDDFEQESIPIEEVWNAIRPWMT